MTPPGGDRPRQPALRVAVVGAGIGGIGLALELAARGVSVDLHEKTDRVHGRASLANEGKIHLGYIYANDPTLRTPRLMAEGSWAFSSILREWLGVELDASVLSRPSTYLVHRKSLLGPEAHAHTYRLIAGLNAEMAARPGASYFGLDGSEPPRLLTTAEREARFGSDIVAAYETPEIAVDPEALGDALHRRVLDEPCIDLRLGSEVLSVHLDRGRPSVTFRRDGHSETVRYDHVINASWEDLLRIDATAGLPAPPESSFRWRHVVRIRTPHGGSDVPSASVVLGAFGDVVEYGSGDLFLSWYPVGRRGRVTSLRPPAAWSDGAVVDDADEVRTGTFAALRSLMPALGSVAPEALTHATARAGVVYARGRADIDDARSGYHRRDAIGPRSLGRYHSFDTGKYTTAPLFARRLVNAIVGNTP